MCEREKEAELAGEYQDVSLSVQHSECEYVCVCVWREWVSLSVSLVGAPLQVSTLSLSFCFLLFFRKDGALNFFFFFEGDFEGDPSGVTPASFLGGVCVGAG